MTPEDVFLDAMLDEDDVDTSRLVFADWLDEHGQPERAEFLRVQCELSNWVPDLERRESLKRREKQLLEEYAPKWLGELANHCLSWRFIRGLAHITIDASVFLEQVAPISQQWVRQAWVQRLRLEYLSPQQLSEFLSRLSDTIPELDFSRSRWDVDLDGVLELLSIKAMTTLRRIDLSNTSIGFSPLEFTRCPFFQSVRKLDLRNHEYTCWLGYPYRTDGFEEWTERLEWIDCYGTFKWSSEPLIQRSQQTFPSRKGEVIHNSIRMRLAYIPTGTFLMGASGDEEGRFANETPSHQVSIRRPFYLGAFPVTQFEYRTVMGTNPSHFRAETVTGEFLPVEGVTWKRAVEFCKRLSALPEERAAGRRYRLPTEAEWEYACRAGTTTPFSCGASLSFKDANFAAESPYGNAPQGTRIGHTTVVGSYPPNDFGLYDMHGNVWEWVNDYYDEAYYQTSPKVDPPGPAKGRKHVLRGGSWFIVGRGCRSAERCYTNEAPVQENGSVGFRVVMESETCPSD